MLNPRLSGFNYQKALFLFIPALHYILGTAAVIQTYWVACLDSEQNTVVTPFGGQFPRVSYQTGNTIVALCSLLAGMVGCLVVEHQQANGVPFCYYLLFAFVSGVIVSVGFVLYPAWIGGLAVCVVLSQCSVLFVMNRWHHTERERDNAGINSRILTSVPEEGEGYV